MRRYVCLHTRAGRLPWRVGDFFSCWQVQWQGHATLAPLQGTLVQIRFTLIHSNLYSFTFTA